MSRSCVCTSCLTQVTLTLSDFMVSSCYHHTSLTYIVSRCLLASLVLSIITTNPKFAKTGNPQVSPSDHGDIRLRSSWLTAEKIVPAHLSLRNNENLRSHEMREARSTLSTNWLANRLEIDNSLICGGASNIEGWWRQEVGTSSSPMCLKISLKYRPFGSKHKANGAISSQGPRNLSRKWGWQIVVDLFSG